MPWTFAHPAAVLPLLAWFPNRLRLAALVVGSLTPDFGYYILQFDLSEFSHTPPGVVVACLPVGVLLMAVYYALRRPVWYLLPQPHRDLLAPWAIAPLRLDAREAFWIAVSLVAGAFTHLAWDAFTHDHGWFVKQWPTLLEPLLEMQGRPVPTYQFLQHASTAFGCAVLGAAYFLWAKRQAGNLFRYDVADRWRYRLVGCLAAAAVTISVPLATERASTEVVHPGSQSLVFLVVVFATVFFSLSLSASAVLCHALRRDRS